MWKNKVCATVSTYSKKVFELFNNKINFGVSQRAGSRVLPEINVPSRVIAKAITVVNHRRSTLAFRKPFGSTCQSLPPFRATTRPTIVGRLACSTATIRCLRQSNGTSSFRLSSTCLSWPTSILKTQHALQTPPRRRDRWRVLPRRPGLRISLFLKMPPPLLW